MTANVQRALRCIGEPVSWLRLERWALAERDGGSRAAERAEIDVHLAQCDACRACADELRADVVVLAPLGPLGPLAVPAGRALPRRAWWTWLAPALGVVAAAAAVLLLWRSPRGDDDATAELATTRVKGIGAVTLGVVRERAGAIRDDVTTYVAGDRWKLVVTCPPGAAAWIDAAVTDATGVPDYPIAPARVACGNRVVVPGAFSITGGGDDRVCVRVHGDGDASLAPLRAPMRAGDPATACITLHAETP